MIPLTPEAREGLAKMVAVADCGKPGLRDPKMTAAMAWIESLPEGGVEPWEQHVDTGCTGCLFASGHTRSVCRAPGSGIGPISERLCVHGAPAPDWCPLRAGGVLVVGVP
jgi:hypothetical protein